MIMKSILDHEEDICGSHVPKQILNKALDIKKSIKEHKWIEGQKGNNLSWAEAKDDWLQLQPIHQKNWAALMFSLEPYMLNDE